MDNHISIREARPTDFESIFQFVCSLQNKQLNKNELASLYEGNLRNPDNIYLVAANQSKSIGYISCHLQTLLHHGGKVAEIQEMFVLPEYRSLGIGKLLMNEIKKKVKEMDALQLEVTTRAIREKAIQFYLREEFQDSHKKLVYHFK